MKFRIIIPIATIAIGLSAPLAAQEDGSEVVLPLEAQTCNLPAAPKSIPEVPSYDDLKAAKDNITGFQQELMTYRECLDASVENTELTDGNRMAVNQAHNYSVDMETRVAEQFNVAVRAYKAAQAEASE